jgi:hypothetical protein
MSCSVRAKKERGFYAKRLWDERLTQSAGKASDLSAPAGHSRRHTAAQARHHAPEFAALHALHEFLHLHELLE